MTRSAWHRKPKPNKQQGQKSEVRRPPIIGAGSSFNLKPWWVSDWWLLDKQGHSSDVVCDVGIVGDLAIAAASIRGNSHRIKGLRCEDSFCLTTGATGEEAPFLVAVIGDGVGSAKYSAYGSTRVTDLFATKLASRLSEADELEEQLVDSALAATAEEVQEAVKSWDSDDYLAPPEDPGEVSPAEFVTTLSFAVMPAYPSGDNESRPVYWGAVGDSPIFKLSDSGWEKVSAGVDGEVYDSATEVFQGVTGLQKCITSRITNTEVLVLTTDGVGNCLVSEGKTLPVGLELGKRWLGPVEIEPFLSDLMFDFRGEDDDRTAVVCWLDRTRSVD